MTEERAAKEHGGKRAAPTAWISHGFEELVASRDAEPDPGAIDFDVVIVGSGYGGAIAAARLAGAMNSKGDKVTVCVLERGREYLPGMFPPHMSDLAGHVRFSTDGATCPRGEREGLFDVRIGADVSAVVANGLGGGSLINAGVMAEPADEVWTRPEWPAAIRGESADVRRDRFMEMRVLLGAALRDGEINLADGKPEVIDNTVERDEKSIPKKFEVLRRMAKQSNRLNQFRAAPITVALTDKRVSSAGVRLVNCLRCGDCATGCNHGAKDSLDVNLLRTAEQARALIYTGATVLRIVPRRATRTVDDAAYSPDAWILEVAHTDVDLRARQAGVFKLVASKVILAAGTFGSTEILLRSRADDLVFSSRLGQRFSSNGDMIAVAYEQKDRPGAPPVVVNAIANEDQPPKERGVGPTITGIVDLRDGRKTPVVIEELAVPGPLRRVFEEVVTTGHTLRELARADRDDHVADGSLQDPCAVRRSAIQSSSILAIMGNDEAGGALELVGGSDEADGDGAIRVRWPDARDHPVFGDGIDALCTLGDESGIVGEVQSNPIWQLLPDDLQFLFENKRGPLLTVHPLGGCPMGDTAFDLRAPANGEKSGGNEKKIPPALGVVNDQGQVFNGAPGPDGDSLFKSLLVLDGSIVPTSLGINPSLTIAALAYRAVEKVRREWNWTEPAPVDPRPSTRPVFQKIPDRREVVPTTVEIIERMSGDAMLPAMRGGSIRARIELTMHFEPKALVSMFLPGANDEVALKRVVKVVPEKSRVRVFVADDWDAWRRRAGKEAELDGLVQYSAPLEGSLAFLHRATSEYPERRCRAIRAWIWNRGTRDTWQAIAKKIADFRQGIVEKIAQFPRHTWQAIAKKIADFRAKVKLPPLAPGAGNWRLCRYLPFLGNPCRRFAKRIDQLFALASHAGEVRLFDYRLTILEPDPPATASVFKDSVFRDKPSIVGTKRLTYSRRSNPWWQMIRMSLDTFPGLDADPPPVLELDTNYLTQQGAPLLRILAQNDEPAAIADLASVGVYFLRLLMCIHVWSFRKPDPADPGEPQRLPGIVKGLPEPLISEIVVAKLPDGRPVKARLTRYPRPASTRPPILLIPGYSASGTTFAHPALDPHMAGFLFERGRDVWILDMRTSAGMPTARMPWAFEDVALADIPAAVNFNANAARARRWQRQGAQDRRVRALHGLGDVQHGAARAARLRRRVLQ
jgi:hypothetical protein